MKLGDIFGRSRKARPAPASDAMLDGDAFTEAYFRMVEETSARGADLMVASIVRDLRPQRLVDVGCGPGVFLTRLRDLGVDVSGVDASEIALSRCRERALSVVRVDLEQDPLPSLAASDTALCLEVGNLIAGSAADRCVGMLCTVGRAVVFSAGAPGQGGDRVRNEQPPEYWIEKFRRRGFACDLRLSLRWRANWRAGGTAPWFATNVLVFKR